MPQGAPKDPLPSPKATASPSSAPKDPLPSPKASAASPRNAVTSSGGPPKDPLPSTTGAPKDPLPSPKNSPGSPSNKDTILVSNIYIASEIPKWKREQMEREEKRKQQEAEEARLKQEKLVELTKASEVRLVILEKLTLDYCRSRKLTCIHISNHFSKHFKTQA